MKIKETYTFIHKEIIIFVRIDYLNNKVDLLDLVNSQTCKFSAKKWVFSQRGIEFMDNWIIILEAMQEAIKDAKKKLGKYQDGIRNKSFEEFLNK